MSTKINNSIVQHLRSNEFYGFEPKFGEQTKYGFVEIFTVDDVPLFLMEQLRKDNDQELIRKEINDVISEYMYDNFSIAEIFIQKNKEVMEHILERLIEKNLLKQL